MFNYVERIVSISIIHQSNFYRRVAVFVTAVLSIKITCLTRFRYTTQSLVDIFLQEKLSFDDVRVFSLFKRP